MTSLRKRSPATERLGKRCHWAARMARRWHTTVSPAVRTQKQPADREL
jgi:hypothetical protein